MLVLIRILCVAKVFKYYPIVKLLTTFKGINKASRSHIIRLEKTNNNFA